jgi:hypothetical protein
VAGIDDLFKNGLGGGIAVAIGAAVIAPVVAPVLGRIMKPLVKNASRAGSSLTAGGARALRKCASTSRTLTPKRRPRWARARRRLPAAAAGAPNPKVALRRADAARGGDRPFGARTHPDVE